MKKCFLPSLFVLSLVLSTGGTAWSEDLVSVGVSRVDVTPTFPVVLAGYGGRQSELEGIDTKLWARAMVIGDKEPVAVVVLDNCGVPQAVRDRVAAGLKTHGIDSDRLVVAVTHTHNAPNLVGYARILWAGRTTPEQDERMGRYTDFAVQQMQVAVVLALKNRRELNLEWAQGRVDFGGNRRIMSGGQWRGFGHQRNAPVDHSLPILAARDAEGKVVGVWANYACHCTTVGGRNRVSGDWAGFANDAMEEAFPGAVSLMSIGCGADIGPQPSGNLDVARQHGKTLAAEVTRVLAGSTHPLKAQPSVVSRRVALPLETPKPRSHWEGQLKAGGFHHQLARSMLHRLDTRGEISDEVDYPVSVWSFGQDLAMVFLAGEVVVDYSVRLNRELDWTRLWITAWANDMPGYIPSKRVLKEGGYEADFSQVYYDQPGRYDPAVEDVLVSAVREMVGPRFAAAPDQEPAPFHRPPSTEPKVYTQMAAWAAKDKEGREAEIFRKIQRFAAQARPGFGKVIHNDGEGTDWHNFAGEFVPRVFIRQTRKGITLAWDSAPSKEETKGKVVLSFLGGVGWRSNPVTDGFELQVGDRARVTFDVTQEPSLWVSGDEQVELLYLPTWTSNEDSGGFFFVVLPEALVDDEGVVSFQVKSLGEGSQRWFAIDLEQKLPERLPKLVKALQR